MRSSLVRALVTALCAVVAAAAPLGRAAAEEITSKRVLESIEKAKRFLMKAQRSDGSWRAEGGSETWSVGITSLALLALLNTGMTADDAQVRNGLNWLRKQDPSMTYEISLMIQALAAAKEPGRDNVLIATLVKRLEDTQVRDGANAGSWSYGTGHGVPDLGGDRSNGQFAVLGLREAQEAGVPVSLTTWRRARNHWRDNVGADGGWGYSGKGGGRDSSASMTVAGIATMIVTEAMVKAEQKEIDAQGNPICCNEPEPDEVLEKACRWLGNNFAVGRNVGGNHWVLYYLYGLERAGRFSGRRFFTSSKGDKHDWYREGADFLVRFQNPLAGFWKGNGHMENDPVIATSFGLMFLSKGLAPVLINKLEYGPREPGGKKITGHDWNRHRDDVRNITQYISNRPRWPRLLSWQVVDISQANVADLLQSPIVYFSGSEAPHFAPEEVALLKEYVLQGGFILAVNNCRSAAFKEGFEDLVRQMYPPSEAQLRLLGADHPVFRSEFKLLDNEGKPAVELWGVDVGCRTSIMYVPDDVSCLWDKWTSFDIPTRPKELLSMITKATSVGVNIVAYVTGREINDKLTQQELVVVDGAVDQVERDLLQIAKVRYTGDWDAAPQALRNLLIALNRTVGLSAATKQRDLLLGDPNVFRYPILYMHGRHDFALGKNEQEKLKKYIENGGFLFADACCGAPAFDRSFRRLMEQVFPDQKLVRIPPDHEMFTSKIGHDLKSVKRREPDLNSTEAGLAPSIRTVEPFLEGIEINGRFVVIYSKYDISCALERQASVACTGYIHEDAVRLGVNIVLYALDQ